MASKEFYLLGDNPSTARTIEFPESADFEELQKIVASHFAIVEHKGNNSHWPLGELQLTHSRGGTHP